MTGKVCHGECVCVGGEGEGEKRRGGGEGEGTDAAGLVLQNPKTLKTVKP